MSVPPGAARPLIGITADLLPWKARVRFTAYTSYAHAIWGAGGLPVAVPPVPEALGDTLHRLEGLLLPGGDDIDPRYYGEEARHPMEMSHEERTRFEIEAAREGLRRRLPVLGVCLGCQTLNVAFGGTLVQDIPGEVPGALVHKKAVWSPLPEHPIEIAEGTRLRSILGARAIVNSSHHQGIGRIAPRWIVSARSADGLPEAIELPGETFALGVQWHPEEMADRDGGRLVFRALVEAARQGRHRG